MKNQCPEWRPRDYWTIPVIALVLVAGLSCASSVQADPFAFMPNTGEKTIGMPCPAELVTVFFHPEASKAEISRVQAALELTRRVQKIRFVPSDIAFDELKVVVTDPSASTLSVADMPPSLRVVTMTAAGAQTLKDAAKNLAGVWKTGIATAAQQHERYNRVYLDTENLVRKLGNPGPPCR